MPENITSADVWRYCLTRFRDEVSLQQYNTWIRPLCVESGEAGLTLSAPNRFIRDFVEERFGVLIHRFAEEGFPAAITRLTIVVGVRNKPKSAANSAIVPRENKVDNLSIEVGTPCSTFRPSAVNSSVINNGVSNNSIARPYSLSMNALQLAGTKESIEPQKAQLGVNMGVKPYSDTSAFSKKTGVVSSSGIRPSFEDGLIASKGAVSAVASKARAVDNRVTLGHQHNLIKNYTFASFVEGKSNQLALAAAQQVAENPGNSYNPLFLYGGVGLGKTHLMHAVGNALLHKKADAKVVYLHSERFVADMVKALQLNAISDFKRYYRSVDALLIDDIQFFAKKDRSQEEFFHTFNALLESGQQMILTCDRYPKEIDGLEERLKSRFGWGLTVAVEPPELETRVAILMKKAEQSNIDLSSEAAFFIAKCIRSNVRELEGALKRVIANANFTGRPLDIALIKDSLKDLLALQDRSVSLDNIKRTIADYYKIKVADLMSKRRSRSIARPRQVAMALAKELTSHSLPEIGDSFGGRDHTTVLHACRKIKELREVNSDICEDHKNLLRLLTT